MADFDTAWAFTRTWEGPYSTSKSDSGHFFPRETKLLNGLPWAKRYIRTQMGTNFGLTPQFLFDYVAGYQYDDTASPPVDNLPTQAKMSSFSEEEVKDIWHKTAWVWCRGDDIKDQNLATLLFDWTVRVNGDCMKTVPTFFGLELKSGNTFCSYVDLGTRTLQQPDAQRNQKVYRFNDLLVAKINKHPNPKALFEAFKKKMVHHVAVRRNALQYNAMVYNTMPNRLTQNITTDNSTNWGKIALKVGAVWLGGRIFKWW